MSKRIEMKSIRSTFELIHQQNSNHDTIPISFAPKRKSPYLLAEDTNVVLSISGGRTSGYLLKKVLDTNKGKLPTNCVAIFQNTGKEKEETYKFIKDMEDNWGVEIIWLEYAGKNKFNVVSYETANRTGAPFKKMVIDKSYYLPNPMQRTCTIQLKTVVMSQYCRDTLGWEEIENWVGIRADEPRRFKMEGPNKANKLLDEEKYLPLRRAKVTKTQILSWWKAQSFDLALGPHDGNCDLCHMKGVNNVMSQIRLDPSIADFWIGLEKMCSEYHGKPVVFNKDRPSYKRLKQIALDQPDLFIDDADNLPCNCTD